MIGPEERSYPVLGVDWLSTAKGRIDPANERLPHRDLERSGSGAEYLRRLHRFLFPGRAVSVGCALIPGFHSFRAAAAAALSGQKLLTSSVPKNSEPAAGYDVEADRFSCARRLHAGQ